MNVADQKLADMIETRATNMVHTSVDDALSSARHAAEPVILRAIALELQKSPPRTALVTGLHRELRRRAKEAKQ